MSLNKLTESVIVKPYLNPYFNTLVVGNDIEYKYYSARVYLNSPLAITGGVSTPISFNTLETNGNQNFNISLPQSSFTIPVAGKYQISYQLVNSSVAAYGISWIEISSSITRRFAESSFQSGSGIQNNLSNTLSYQFNGGETVRILVFFLNNTNILGNGPMEFSSLQIERLHS